MGLNPQHTRIHELFDVLLSVSSLAVCSGVCPAAVYAALPRLKSGTA